MSKYIKPYGNPNGSVFGKLGETLYTDDGKIYYKEDNDATNIGWKQIYPVVPTATPTPTPTPTVTPVPAYVTPTPAPTRTPTPTPTPTSTPVGPTATPTPTIAGPTPTPTATPTVTPTGAPTFTPTPTPAPTLSPTATPIPTATPVPAFTFTSATLIGATYYNDANSLIIGITMSGTAFISLVASWTRPATGDDPVIIKVNGSTVATLISSETSYNTNQSLSSNTTLQFVRNSLTGDTATVTVSKISGSGNMINVSGRCLTTAYTAMDLNVSGITSTYDYNIRNCTTGTNSSYTSVSNSYQPTTTGTINPPAISFIEFVNTGAGFAYPSLSPLLP